MTSEEAKKKIEELKQEAMAKIREAEEIASLHSVSFSFDVAYGMGGWYESGEWNSSSMEC